MGVLYYSLYLEMFDVRMAATIYEPVMGPKSFVKIAAILEFRKHHLVYHKNLPYWKLHIGNYLQKNMYVSLNCIGRYTANV